MLRDPFDAFETAELIDLVILNVEDPAGSVESDPETWGPETDRYIWVPNDDDYRPEPEPFRPTPEDERQAVLMLNARSESCPIVPPSAYGFDDVEFPDAPLW